MQQAQAGILFLLLATGTAAAQVPERDLPDSTATQPLGRIEVTATRVAETVDASLADVAIITRADIDASGAPDLIELLRRQPGVDVARGGGPGEQTGVFLRGTNSNHVLVLIDGVRVASTNTGAFAFENLPLDAIERIEIVRGPRASYWGSDAIGGVIQVFTRELSAAHVAARYGSWRDAAGSAGTGAWSDAGGFSVQVGARHVGGFSATNPGICNGPDDPYCIYNPDANGYHNHDLVARGGARVGEQTLAATLFRNEGGVSFDNGAFGAGYTTTLDQAFGIDLSGPVTPAWSQRLALGSAREDLATAAFGSAYRSTREQLAWTNEVAVSPTQRVVAGIDAVHDRGVTLDATGFGAPYDRSRDGAGVFGGWNRHGGALDAEVAARYDRDSDFGAAWSGSAALAWRPADAVRVTASVGSAFRAPNLNELYSPGYGGYFAGNPDLDPEHSRSVEAGADWRIAANHSLGLRAFSTRVHDLIDFTGGTTFRAINIDEAAIDGAELMHHWRGARWSLDTNATWQDPRDRASGQPLLRRPKRKLSSVLGVAATDRLAGALELFASGRADDVAATQLPGYALVSLRADYRLGTAWLLTARLDNLFDRDYALVHGYNTPGRSAFVGVSWDAH